MATFTDISELEGYEIPASGETIEIDIAENYCGEYLLVGSNIVNFNAEDGNQVGEVVTSNTECRFYGLDGAGESVTITFEIGENQSLNFETFDIVTYDLLGEMVADYAFYQEEGEPPAPVWEDGQHKIYRSGQQVMKMYRSGNLIYLRLNPNNEPEPEYDKIPFTFEVLSAGTISWKAGTAATQMTIQYSINDGSWVSITSSTAGTTFNVAAGDKVRFKGTNSTYSTQSGGTYANTFGGTTAQVKVYGNIMSLTNGDNFQSAKTFSGTYVFRNLLNFSAIVDAEHLILPATALTAGCYMGMLTDSSITVAPNLPAAYVHMNCYYNMFLRCTKLTTVQAILPAETVYESCYRAMFYGCTNLTTAPELPAKSLANNCYNQMFDQCSKLNYIKCLATTISTATTPLNNWVRGVAASGTFVKDSSMTGWTTGTNGIPSGWTVENYTPTPTENWVDLTTIDNDTPIYNIAWLSDQGFSTINDTWFSEEPGLVTDSNVDDGNGWSYGKTADKGYYTYHRMSNTYKKYSCTFLDQYYTGNGANVEYGVAMTDAFINELPTSVINGNTYYTLNIVDWQNWKPLYMPLSTSKIQSTYVEGMILVDIAPKT